MNAFEAPKKTDAATENGRFNQQPMCTSLTGECARKFKAGMGHVEYDDGDESTEYHSNVVYGSDGKPIGTAQTQEE